jgi:two-component system NtrC family sensor kinase
VGDRIAFGNQAAAWLLGATTPSELMGREILDLVSPAQRDLFSEIVDRTATGTEELPFLETRVQRLDQTTVDVEACFSQILQEKQALQITMRDITDRKEMQDKVWRQANFDLLTGIPNRLLFHDRLQQVILQAERESFEVALLFLDLDQFKEVNDLLGHEAGDDLLRQAAQRITAAVRATDTLARLGGDEFTIIMPRVTGRPAVAQVAGRILKSLSEPFRLSRGQASVGGSIGIAIFPRDGADIPTLIRNADAAMYRAKEGGRNMFSFYSA